MQSFRPNPVVDRLRTIDQFKSCKRTQLRVVARMTEQVKVPEGQAIVKEGEFGNDFFLILTGTAGVTQKGRPVNALGPGDFFGELAVLVRGTTRNATVTADSELDLLVIGRRESPAMFEIPRFREALLTKMASQLSTADARLANALDAKEGFEVA